jgi:hypothetical protein
MKNQILILCLFTGLFSFQAMGQDCTFAKQGKDPNNGEPFKESRNVLGKNLSFQLRKDGTSKLSCFLDLVIVGSMTYTIGPKDTLYLKLENYEMLKLVPEKECAPKKISNMNGVVSKYVPYYRITREILEKLAVSPVAQFRVSFDNVIEGTPKKPESEGIMKAASCLLKD